MHLWTFLIVATAVWGAVELLTNLFEHDKETRIAKIEAKLKRDLVDQLGDAELVARVIEARLPRTDAKGEPVQSLAEVDVARLRNAKSVDGPVGSGLLLGGMICLLLGVAFLVLSAAFKDEFIVPCVLVTAVGFALLAYPSARDELARSRRRRQDSGAEA